MEAWKRVEPTQTEKVGWRTIVTKTFTLPDDSTHSFQLFNKEDSHNVGVIALTPDKRVIIARQFRPGPEIIMDEIPGGGVEADESNHQAAAMRELLEETGYTSDKVVYLGSVYKDAYNNSQWHYYLAEDCERQTDKQDLDDAEAVEIGLISISALIDNARNGRMTDVEAVFLGYDRLKELEEN